MGDSNRNLAISALDILATLATSMGRPFEKYAKQIASSISGCLADNKIHVRTAALSALDAFKSKCSLDSFVGTLSQALVADQPLLRKDLLKWLGDSFEASSANLPDLSQFVHPILLCIQDRNVEVRKNAQVVLGFVVQYVGYDSVREKSEELFRGAQLQTIAPIIEAAASSASSKQTVASTSTVNKPQPGTPRKRHTSASTSSSSREEAAAAPVAASKIVAPSSKSSARSKVGAGGTRPSSLNLKKEVVEPVSIDKEAPLLSSDMRAKDIRADRDRGLTKWTFETPRRELIDFLMEQCESNFSSEVHGWMFSTDHYKERDFITAISALLDPLLSPDNCQGLYGIQYTDLKKRYIANADLILKYLTLRFFDTNTSMLIKCLELLENFFGLLEECEYYLCEYEASCFLPFFVNKVSVYSSHQ